MQVRGDAQAGGADPRVKRANDEDWRTEYLDAIISVKVVNGIEEAMDHIESYGSHHTDCIVTECVPTAELFLKKVAG